MSVPDRRWFCRWVCDVGGLFFCLLVCSCWRWIDAPVVEGVKGSRSAELVWFILFYSILFYFILKCLVCFYFYLFFLLHLPFFIWSNDGFKVIARSFAPSLPQMYVACRFLRCHSSDCRGWGQSMGIFSRRGWGQSMGILSMVVAWSSLLWAAALGCY